MRKPARTLAELYFQCNFWPAFLHLCGTHSSVQSAKKRSSTMLLRHYKEKLKGHLKMYIINQGNQGFFLLVKLIKE